MNERKCDICGKISKHTNKIKGVIYCPKHYGQYIRYGKPIDNNPTTCNDKNNYKIIGEYTIVYTTNKNGEVNNSFIIDTEDLERVLLKKWRYSNNDIMQTLKNTKKTISIQRYILDCINEKCVVDHINHNRLDNRKQNLRKTIQQKNMCNRKIQKSNNVHGFLGIYYDKERNKWSAEITYCNTKCYLGRYQNKYDAIYARYISEIIIFKEFRSEENDENINEQIILCTDKEQIKNKIIKKIQKSFPYINIE